MKMKRILSFICVLALALSLCSVFSFATAPEAEANSGGIARTGGVHYVLRQSAYMYVSPSISSAYACPSKLPVGTHMVRVNQTLYQQAFYKMTCNYQGGTYTGYVLADRLTEVQ